MDNIFVLLSQHNFTIVNNNNDDFQCIICRRILTNACQGTCGCNYCQKCVDEHVERGEMFCPGFTEECKTSKLSSVTTDNRVNRQISQLVMKCPEEACSYESQLRAMGEHLRFCPKKSVNCPFIDVGCDRRKLAMDKLDEHLQQESFRHNEILIGAIGILRNEVAELKRNGENYRLDIDRLLKYDKEKGALIESMKEEIKSIKLENSALERRIENILEDKCDKTAMEINGRCMLEIIEPIETQLREMRRWTCEGPPIVELDAKTFLTRNNADFLMTVDKIAKWRRHDKDVFSEYFNGCSQPYKMQLRCHPGAYSELWVNLFIHAGDSDQSLQWPFEANVTITIVNQMRPKARKSITKYCSIPKPSYNHSYRISDAFKFEWKELSDEGLLHGDRLIAMLHL